MPGRLHGLATNCGGLEVSGYKRKGRCFGAIAVKGGHNCGKVLIKQHTGTLAYLALRRVLNRKARLTRTDGTPSGSLVQGQIPGTRSSQSTV